MRRVLFCMLEAVEGELCLLEVIRCVLLVYWKAVEGRLCLLEAMRFMLLCMPMAVEGGLCLGAGGDAMYTSLYAEGCGERALFTGPCWM